MTSLSNFKRRNEKGLTIFSVMLIMVALGGTTLVAYLAVDPTIFASQADVTVHRIDRLRAAIKKYQSHHDGTAPGALDDLVIFIPPACEVDRDETSPTYRKLKGWCGPYLDRTIEQDLQAFKRDGWGQTIQYNGSTLTSCGSDRVCGNGDDIAIAL